MTALPGGKFNLTFTVAGSVTATATPLRRAIRPPRTDIIVNSSTTGMPQSTPDVATDSKGNYVVVWDDYNAYGEATFTFSGSTIGQADRLGVRQSNTYTTGSQIEPAVAMDSFGDFVVVWSGPGSER